MDTDVKLRALIYARTSSDDGKFDIANQKEKPRRIGHKRSIDLQLQACRELCARANYEVVEVFVDQNVSGRTYPQGRCVFDDKDFESYFKKHIKSPSKKFRKGLAALFERLNDADVIVTRDIFRILRPTKRSYLMNYIAQELSQHKVKIHSIHHGEINVDNFTNILTLSLTLMMADKAKEDELENSIKGLNRKKDEGYLASGADFYGYRWFKKQTMKPVPTEIEIIKKIFSLFLKTKNTLSITRYLNDEIGAKTISGRPWANASVRKILTRPAYAGLRYDSSGQLIPSVVFPSGHKAIIQEADFDKVKAIFKKRREFYFKSIKTQETRRNQESSLMPLRGGTLIGTPRSNKEGTAQIIHPLSGLVRCGICGNSMIISSAKNPYYKKAVAVHYYICHSPFHSNSRKECHGVRILEQYSAEALAQVKEPNGHGLLDALFPVLFVGRINKYIEANRATPDLLDKQSQLRLKLDEVIEGEKKISDSFARRGSKMTQEQFDNIFQVFSEKRISITTDLSNVEALIQQTKLSNVSVPLDLFYDPSQFDPELKRELAHETFKSIIVFPDKIRVCFKDDHWFELDRISKRNSRLLPFFKFCINKQDIIPDTKIGIAYYYPSVYLNDYKVSTLYNNDQFEVISVGVNCSLDKQRSDLIVKEIDPDNELYKILAPPATHKEVIIKDHIGFFTAVTGVRKDPITVESRLMQTEIVPTPTASPHQEE